MFNKFRIHIFFITIICFIADRQHYTMKFCYERGVVTDMFVYVGVWVGLIGRVCVC